MLSKTFSVNRRGELVLIKTSFLKSTFSRHWNDFRKKRLICTWSRANKIICLSLYMFPVCFPLKVFKKKTTTNKCSEGKRFLMTIQRCLVWSNLNFPAHLLGSPLTQILKCFSYKQKLHHTPTQYPTLSWLDLVGLQAMARTWSSSFHDQSRVRQWPPLPVEWRRQITVFQTFLLKSEDFHCLMDLKSEIISKTFDVLDLLWPKVGDWFGNKLNTSEEKKRQQETEMPEPFPNFLQESCFELLSV